MSRNKKCIRSFMALIILGLMTVFVELVECSLIFVPAELYYIIKYGRIICFAIFFATFIDFALGDKI